MFLKGHDETSHKHAYIMPMESSRLSVAAEEDIYIGNRFRCNSHQVQRIIIEDHHRIGHL